MRRWVVLLAWWFFWAHASGTPAVGPFRDELDCLRLRSFVLARAAQYHVSWCWWDGKP